MKFNPTFLAAITLAMATGAAAQTMKPGLWEINNRTGSGEMEKAMAGMPPEQRKQMQDMLDKQGMTLNSAGGVDMSVKTCMTQEMAEGSEIPSQQQGNCETSHSPRSGNTIKFSYTCAQPPSSGEILITVVSNTAYTMKMESTATVQGKAGKKNMEQSGKWLSADCGGIKPITAPKK